MVEIGRKLLKAAMIFAVVISGASIASADATSGHTVAYEVVSFRYIALEFTDGVDCTTLGLSGAAGSSAFDDNPQAAVADGGCAVSFQTRHGDAAEKSGGLLKYATTLTTDKVVAKLDAAMTNNVLLGVYVDGITAGTPCNDTNGATAGGTTEGTAETGAAASYDLVTGGVAATTGGPLNNGSVDPVVLGTTDVSIITSINNCGTDTAPVEANLMYVLDARNANELDATDTGYSDFLAIKKVTYTLKAA